MTKKRISETHPQLYHYTNRNGLFGILESQSLWATHYKSLNDRKEIVRFADHLFELILPTVFEAANRRLSPIEIKEIERRSNESFSNIVSGTAKSIVEKFYKVLGDRFFITSFCSHEDKYEQHNGLLSQWRGYGQDSGYAIIFDTERLSKMLDAEYQKFPNYVEIIFDSVVYEHDKQNYETEFHKDFEEIRKLVDDEVLGIIDRLPISEERINIAKEGYVSLVKCTSRTKHEAFKEEKEIRIVAIMKLENSPEQTNKIIKERNKDDAEITYLELFDTSAISLPIEKIIVGPGKNQEQRKEELIEFLKQQKLFIPVTLSETPFI